MKEADEKPGVVSVREQPNERERGGQRWRKE
jgi:hypothetical protein